MKRRSFVQKAAFSAGLVSTGTFPFNNLLAKPETHKLTILHTNDVHSRIEPFPMDGGKYQGLGGAERRAALIQQIRKEEEHVLLLDSGDMFQGTPYFNFFGGELEFKLMSEMKYDATTLGNHDFDAGIDGLHRQLPHANFPFLSANYDFSDTVMNGKTRPYQIFEKGALKIGVFGIGIELEGLVPKTLIGNTIYQNPIERANYYANILKNEEQCHYVICLSHLGFEYNRNKVSDKVLATESRHIDLILGGHTHTFMEAPFRASNLDQKEVLIHQAGWAGLLLGRLDIYFEKNFKNKCVTCKNQQIS